jgi:hypothetical protein
MATLAITRLYAADEVLFELDLDEVRQDIENFVNTIKLNDDNIQDGGITASTKVLDGTITGDVIGSSAIITSKITDGAIDSDALGSSSITTAKIAANTLTGTTFGSGSVTKDKLSTVTPRINTSVIDDDIFLAGETSYAEVVGASVTITATGTKKVLVMLYPTLDSSVTLSSAGTFRGNSRAGGIRIKRGITGGTFGASFKSFLRMKRGSTVLAEWEIQTTISNPSGTGENNVVWSVPSLTFWCFDEPSAGSTTYTLEAKTNGNEELWIYCSMMALELT